MAWRRRDRAGTVVLPLISYCELLQRCRLCPAPATIHFRAPTCFITSTSSQRHTTYLTHTTNFFSLFLTLTLSPSLSFLFSSPSPLSSPYLLFLFFPPPLPPILPFTLFPFTPPPSSPSPLHPPPPYPPFSPSYTFSVPFCSGGGRRRRARRRAVRIRPRVQGGRATLIAPRMNRERGG